VRLGRGRPLFLAPDITFFADARGSGALGVCAAILAEKAHRSPAKNAGHGQAL